MIFYLKQMLAYNYEIQTTGFNNANDLSQFPIGSKNFKNCYKTVKLNSNVNSKYRRTFV